MDGNETNKLVKGALLLTLAGLISKVLSAGYRIPLQNLTGDMGFYIYQQVYPFLGIAFILSLYGFPSAISKITVDLKAQGMGPSFARFYVPIFLLLFSISSGIFLFLFFNAQEIAVWVGDANLKDTYELAAFAFLLIPFSALLRGVFQGMKQMKPTAYSQVGEQFIRVFLIILAAVFIFIKSGDIYSIGQAAAIASLFGALAAIFILGFFFIRMKPTVNQHFDIPWNYYISTLLIFGMIAALNHMLLIIIQFADTFTLVPGLMEHGLSDVDAMEAKGVFDRGQPLIQLGTVLGSSFALALIPTISRRKLDSDPKAFHAYIESALVVSFYLAIGATIGLIIIFPEANTLLFQNGKGTASLQILVISIFLSSIAITAASILQGLGYIKRTAGFILVAFFIKWITNQALVPLFGIMGSAIATVFSLTILAVLMLLALKRKLPNLKVEKHINWRAFTIAATGMIIYIFLIDNLLPGSSSRFGLLLYVLFVVITGALLYIILLLRFRAFTNQEISMLPLVPILTRIHRGRET
ncbi:polysaccharide transporter, PST family [Virgibacillus subterraneus]|uniref:Polysaccharide transporter, PST family n=1 Tax=Virgibacillus subterraneus TaxID=621109 RepID=A0A1H9KII3_9BACI|nr:polysaccharide biosynthesis protein [Virgibacillus subterraneus]SEQ98663.1 polysaccharide transporter, PST family [Virgibacillus subterraneus]